MKKIILMILTACILAGLPTALTGCSGSQPLEKGANAAETIQTDREYTLGSAQKTVWELKVPKNTFDESLSLTMDVLSEEEAKAYQSDAFDLIGTPVKITAGNEDSVRLNQRVTVTMRIPRICAYRPKTRTIIWWVLHRRRVEYISRLLQRWWRLHLLKPIIFLCLASSS